MKHLAVALITVALIVADFMAEVVGLSKKSQKNWAYADGIALVLAAVWFALHIGDEKK